jgi:hypothetical protein
MCDHVCGSRPSLPPHPRLLPPTPRPCLPRQCSGIVVLHWAYGATDDLTQIHTMKSKAWVNLLATGTDTGTATLPATPPPAGPALPPAVAPVVSANATEFTSADGNLHLSWSKSDDNSILYFTATFQTTGWAALGFSPSAIMHEAVDVYLGKVDGGVASLVDSFLDGFGQAIPDMTESNILNYTISEQDGATTIHFSRLVNTGDVTQVRVCMHGWICAHAGARVSIRWQKRRTDGTAAILFLPLPSLFFPTPLCAHRSPPHSNPARIATYPMRSPCTMPSARRTTLVCRTPTRSGASPQSTFSLGGRRLSVAPAQGLRRPPLSCPLRHRHRRAASGHLHGSRRTESTN